MVKLFIERVVLNHLNKLAYFLKTIY